MRSPAVSPAPAREDTVFRDVLVYDSERSAGCYGPTDVHVSQGRIASIGQDVPRDLASAGVVEGHGHHLLLPGLINAHFHSPANHLKGSLPSLPLELFMLYESPDAEQLRPTPREAYLRTMLGAIEMLRSGTTSVQDDAFLMPYPDPDVIDAVMSAYEDSGIRAAVALDQPELPEVDKFPFLAELATLDELTGPGPAPMGDLLESYDYLFRRWHRAANGRLTAAVSVSGPQRVSPAYFAALDDLSRTHDVPIFAHMLETRVQRSLAVAHERFGGRSLVQYTADLGLLSDRMNVIHAIWVDDADLELIAGAGAVVAHNPISNLRLGSGVMPFRRVRDAGIRIALGVDEAICGDAIDMWAVVRMTGLIHNISGRHHETWPSAREVLDCLFEGGAAAMLRGGELGRVAIGALADLVLVNIDSLAFTPLNDVLGQLVYCASGREVVLTMVDGRVVAVDGRVVSVNEDSLLAEARELFSQRAAARAAAHVTTNDRLRPVYEEMIKRVAGVDVGMSRWVSQ